MFFFLFFYALGFVQAQELMPATKVVDSSIDQLGFFKISRPLGYSVLDDSSERLDFTDSLNSLPGIQMRNTGSPVLSIRGSQSSSRVLVMEEGISLNFSDGVGFNPLFLAKENSDGAAIMKGPASSSFGKDAMAGAIDFRSKRTPGLGATQSFGTFNTTSSFARYGQQDKSTFTQVTAFQEHTDGSYRTRNDNETLRSTLLLNGNLGGGTWKSYHLIARQIGSIPGATDFPFPSVFNNIGHLHSLEGGLPLTESSRFFTQTTWAVLEQNYDGSPSKTQSTKQTLRFQKDFSAFTLEVFDQLSLEDFTASYLGPDKKSASYNEAGAYAQIILQEKLQGLLAARVDTALGDVLPSIGITGENEMGWQYFAHYSLGYHPASLTQKYSQSSGLIGNPNIKSEHSDEVDLGFQKNFESYFVKFDAFNRNMSDLIENQLVTPGTLTPRNTGHGNAQGFEFSGWAIINSYKMGGELSYLQNKNTDTNLTLSLSPATQISAFVEKAFDKLSLKFQGTSWSSYLDRSLSTGALTTIAGWTTFDFFSSYALNTHLTLKFSLLNITDQARQLTLGYPEPQRSYRISLGENF